jgi:hypothetical protein
MTHEAPRWRNLAKTTEEVRYGGYFNLRSSLFTQRSIHDLGSGRILKRAIEGSKKDVGH